MSVTDQNGWGEAQAHENNIVQSMKNMLTITTEDRLRGAVVEALSQLEQGHPTAAHQILTDSLKIGGVK